MQVALRDIHDVGELHHLGNGELLRRFGENELSASNGIPSRLQHGEYLLVEDTLYVPEVRFILSLLYLLVNLTQ